MTTDFESQLGLRELAAELTIRSVKYREEPYKLRKGGLSHWYVDLKSGLADGIVMQRTGKFLIESANSRKLDYQVLSAIGIGGHAVLGCLFTHLGPGMHLSWAEDRHEIDEQGIDQYGLHCDVKGKKVWVVDDTATTGDSLFSLIDMVRSDGGIVENADVAVDRSNGVVTRALETIGVSFNSLLLFDESTGELGPRLP
jgi:orotate phosphoribosyltransferase